MHKVSVIIPTLNEENHIPNLLTDLKKQTYSPFEILLIDAESTDKTVKISKKYDGVSVYITKPNPAAQRTFGGNKAKGTILFFLDADVRLKSDFIEKVLKEYDNKKFALACPFYVPYKSTLLITGIYLFFDSIFYLTQKFLPSGAGSCIIATKKIFKETGGFDHSLRFDDIAFIRKAAWNNPFTYLILPVYVSDRRFKKDGVIDTFLLYLLLSIFFISNQFKLANSINYRFNHYTK